jgi:serine/threonine-protein kinase
MPLAIGSRVGVYEVVARIGAGGMGEVYRAHDTKLNRDVAVKILPEAFAHDADRVARLRREAQVLASLNHPNIGHIYGLEESPHALVMELVQGPTLADVGRLRLDQVLSIARQIADALQAAHEHGVVHRDLKPSNIKLKDAWGPTPTRLADGRLEPTLSAADVSDCTVKVLDFGLAKPMAPEASGGLAGGVMDSPTVTSVGTGMGIILGTAAYMSPEQARGRPVDKRTDIWAFGCVLFEMLTGRRAFEGDNVTDLLAGIVARDPDFTLLPASTPAALRRLLRRCLERDVKRRLSDIADARLEIDESLVAPSSSGGPAGVPVAAPPRARWLVAALAIVAAAAVATSVYLWLSPRAAAARPMRFVIAPPASDPMFTESIGTQMAISPDGQYIVYVGVRGSLQLYSRRVDQIEAYPISGTTGARQPFFSPDGKSIGFWSSAEGEIRRVSLTGGPVSPICKAPTGNLYGASWGPDETIVFGSGSLYRVSAAGGKPEELAAPVANLNEAELRWPEILPDGKSVLFTAWGGTADPDRTRIAVVTIADRVRKPLIEGGTTPRYSLTGHLIYHQTGTLMAVAFNAGRLEILGERVPLQEPVKTTVSGAADYAISRSGTLAVVSALTRPERRLVWVDRKGVSTPLLDAPEDYWVPRIAPDGRRLAVGIGPDLWVIELARLTRTRVTYGTTSTLFPYTWSRDGNRIIFSKTKSNAALDLYSSAADGSSAPTLVFTGELRQWAISASPTSEALATYEQHPTMLRDIWILNPDRTRVRFATTPYQELSPRYSPDGKWIVYVSNDSGRYEVYVRAASGEGERITVSTDGGVEPVWVASGKEILYRNGDRLMAAGVRMTPQLAIDRPQLLFESTHERDRGSGVGNANYDATRDGQRFVMVQSPTTSTQLLVVLNWFDELTARMRAGRQ